MDNFSTMLSIHMSQKNVKKVTHKSTHSQKRKFNTIHTSKLNEENQVFRKVTKLFSNLVNI